MKRRRNTKRDKLRIKYIKKWGVNTRPRDFIDGLINETADAVLTDLLKYKSIKKNFIDKVWNRWIMLLKGE